MRRVFARNGCDILRCGACGVGRTVVRAFDPEQYYTRDYFEGGHADGYAAYGSSEEVLGHEFGQMAERLRRFAPAGGTLLEIGCAYGYFLRAARSHWAVHGLEISADAVAECHRAGLDTVRQSAADREALAPLPPLDAVVMLDVIEHLPDPAAVLAACREKLKPGGVLMLTTGDFAAPLARLMGPKWRLMTPPQHLWFFTIAGFRALARREGWEVALATHPTKRVPLSLILYQLRRMLGLRPRARETGGSIGIPVNLFDAMLLVLRKAA